MTTNTSVRLSDQAVRPLSTLDPAGPLDDLDWLDQAVGDARVVAIGESAHFNHEFYRLRHRLLRYLVERHGFSAYAMESGFVEGWQTDDWVRGGGDQLGRVMATGITSLMGLCTEMRAQLEWMRQHNAAASAPVRFYGIDLPGSNASLLPGLDAVTAYLAEADPGYAVDPRLRETAATVAAASTFSAFAAFSAYAQLPSDSKDALTAGLADLLARLTAMRVDYIRRTTAAAYERARHSLHLAVALDAMTRETSRAPQGIHSSIRDAAIADTVEWILRREDRIVLGAHNNHVQRCPMAIPGMLPTSTTMGMHLAERLGPGYLAIGTTSATGQTLALGGGDLSTGEFFAELEPPEPGSLDALMTASHDTPFVADLRRLSPADAEAVRTISRHRNGVFYGDLAPLDSFDLVVHVPRVTPAEPDSAALDYSPAEVQQAFAQWQGNHARR